MAAVITNFLINGLNPVSVGGTGTTVKYFPNASGNFTSGVTPSSVKNGYLFVPDSGKVNNQRLAVRASGNWTVGTGATSSPATTIGLYPVTFAGNVPTGTPTIGAAIISQQLAGASEGGAPGTFYPWALTADLAGDNTSGIVTALGGSIVMDGVAGSFSVANVLTGVNMLSAVPFALLVGVTFSVSDPGALANMYQFDLQN